MLSEASSVGSETGSMWNGVDCSRRPAICNASGTCCTWTATHCSRRAVDCLRWAMKCFPSRSTEVPSRFNLGRTIASRDWPAAIAALLPCVLASRRGRVQSCPAAPADGDCRMSYAVTSAVSCFGEAAEVVTGACSKHYHAQAQEHLSRQHRRQE